VESAQAGAESARAVLALTEKTIDATFTQARGGVTQASSTLTSARASIEQAEAEAETGPQQLATATAALHLAEARVKQAEAARKLAELNLSYTKIRAPHRGAISRRTVEERQTLSPERPLFAIVPRDELWIVANFKEDQLAEMRSGQPARVRFDTYGRRSFVGHVESLAGGSGARFALLPPDNASGNFVKVVQRVPVLLRLDGAPGIEPRPRARRR
jgi:membrane fusion protein (multidrug efflux system)